MRQILRRESVGHGASIRARMTFSMLLSAALFIPVVLIAALYIRRMNESVGNITARDIELMLISNRIELNFAEARDGEKEFLLYGDTFQVTRNHAALEIIEELCGQGRRLAPELAPRFDAIVELAGTYRSLSEPLLRTAPRVGPFLTPSGYTGTEARYRAPPRNVRAAQADSVMVLQQRIAAEADSIVVFARGRVEDQQHRAKMLAAWGQRNIIAVLLVVVVVLIWLVVTMPRRAVLPIKRLINAIRRVEEGDLNVRVNIRTRDELADLARHVNLALARLREFDERKTNRILHLERRFRLLIQDISEGVMVIDRVPNVMLANAAMEPLLGSSASEAAGRRLKSFPNLRFLYEPLESVLAGVSSAQTCEIPPELPGSAVCIEAMRDKSGAVTGALVVVTNPAPPQFADVTETQDESAALEPAPPDEAPPQGEEGGTAR